MKNTKKMMNGVIATLLAGTLAGCYYDEEQSPDCEDWDWDPEKEEFVCDDDEGRGSSGKSYYKKNGSMDSKKEFQGKAKSGIGSGTKGGFFGG